MHNPGYMKSYYAKNREAMKASATRRYHELRDAGLCVDACGAAAVVGKARCVGCAEIHAVVARAKREAKKGAPLRTYAYVGVATR